MKHYTIVGNWKLHNSPNEAVALVRRLQAEIKPHTHVTAIICPPFIDLQAVHGIIDSDTLKLGAQNLYQEDEGAYTGEVSGTMLSGLVTHVIVGHSERRKFFHETDKIVSLKLAAAVRNGLKPILCVGENLQDRNDGHSKLVVVDQLKGALSQLTADDLRHLTVAYEPVWAIGTGEFAKPYQAEQMAVAIKHSLVEMYDADSAGQVEVLYGGSADADNAKAYLSEKSVSGLLVGGASLHYDAFAKIVATAHQLAV